MPEKVFILDTNILIYDPESIFAFEGVTVGIPVTVLEELDSFKGEKSERGRNAREAIRHFDALRERGALADGVHLDNGGVIKVLFIPEIDRSSSPLKANIPDNDILLTALAVKDKGNEVKFVSKDIAARVKADVLGIEAVDYLADKIKEVYKGWVEVLVPAASLKKEFPDELEELLEVMEEPGLLVNQFVLLKSRSNQHNYKVFRYLGGKKFRKAEYPHLLWPLEARNPHQLMALDLLFDPAVQLVSLIGAAGTGKTFLALLAGLHQVLAQEIYEKLLISRPVIPLGPDIGYLPGDVQEKLESWMQPIYDNIDFITHSASARNHLRAVREEPEYRGKGKKKGKIVRKKESGFFLRSLDELIHQHKVSLEAITYMRGRSIPYQFILIDEVQNLNPHEVKTLITRVGEGSKIVLTGDPYQIDSPYLDFTSNGLVVASNKFRGQKLFGTVFLEYSERSELSRLANELL